MGVSWYARAAHDRDCLRAANSLHLLCGRARDAAYKSGQEERFAEGMVQYEAAVRALAFPTVALDLAAHTSLCGDAFQAASIRPELSADQVLALRSKAILALKQAASDGMRSSVMNPEATAERWNALGQALLRVEDLGMANYAFHWGLHIARGSKRSLTDMYETLIHNLVFLGKHAKAGKKRDEDAEREQSLAQQVKEVKATLPKLSFGRCRVCREDTDKTCACKKGYYCSRTCQSQDWKRHKPECRQAES